MAEEPEPITIGNVTVQESRVGTTSMDLESLEAAQSMCAEMVADISAADPIMATDIMVGFTTVVEDEPGSDRENADPSGQT
jgi:hypothetical protein